MDGGFAIHLRALAAVLALAALVAPLAAAQDVPPPVRLTAASPGAAALPGQAANFEVVANNTGPIPLTLHFETTAIPPDWTVEFQPGSLTVPGGGTAKSTFIVYVPGNAEPGTVASLAFVARDDIDQVISDTLRLNVTVLTPEPPPPTPTPDVSLSIAGASGRPGTEVESLLTILSREPERLSVRLSVAPTGEWNPHFKDGITVYTVDPGVATNVPVRALVPADATEGEREAFVLTASIVGRGHEVQIGWNVTALAPVAPTRPPEDSGSPAPTPPPTQPTSSSGGPAPTLVRLEVRTSVERLDIEPGQTLTAALLLKNTGNVPLTLDLKVQAPAADWGVRLDTARVELPAGESRDVRVHVTAPDGIPPGGTADVTFQAIDGNLVQRATLNVGIVAGAITPTDETNAAAITPDTSGDGSGAFVPTAAWVAIGIGGVGTVALAVANRPLREKLLWAGVGLYTRLAQPDILGHPERDRLYKLVEAQPGIHFHALQRDLGWNTGTLTYHLRVLERHQFLVSRRDGPYRRFFKVGTAPRKELFSVDAPQGLRADVLEAIRNRHGLSQSDLALALGANKQTVNYHVKALERQGIIRVERRGRETFLYPHTAGVGPAAGSEAQS